MGLKGRHLYDLVKIKIRSLSNMIRQNIFVFKELKKTDTLELFGMKACQGRSWAKIQSTHFVNVCLKVLSN